MSDIAEFLRARLDEDEKVARAATVARPWHVHTASGYHGDVTWISDSPDAVGFSEPSEVQHPVGYYDPEPVGLVSPADAAHIARHDPARVLAEVAAKRAILARLADTAPPYADSRQQEIHETLRDEVVPHLAAVHASHEAYRPEWAP